MSSFDIKYTDNDDIISRGSLSGARKKEAQLARIVLNQGFMPTLQNGETGKRVMLSNGKRAIFLGEKPMPQDAYILGLLKAGIASGIDGQALYEEAQKEGLAMQTCNAVQETIFNNFAKKSTKYKKKALENMRRNVEEFRKVAREAGLELGLALSIEQQFAKDIEEMQQSCLQSEIEDIISK